MLSKIIACISAKQATAGLWRTGRFVSCAVFTNDEAGHDKFRAFLLSHRNAPVHLIADAVEEDYRLETMPHSSGQARKEMLQRKLSQLYRNSSYRTAQFIGRANDKRRDDRILFTALVNPDLLTPWVTAIEDQQAPLAGVYLLPMVSQLLVNLLKLKHPDLLLMTRQTAGLRQNYFSGQHLRLSRITPLAGLDEETVDKLYLSETERTRLYLISLRMLAREVPVNLVYLATTPLAKDFSQQLEATQGVTCDIIPPKELAKKLGLSTDLLARYPDLLHMQALAKGQIRDNLADDSKIKNYRLLQIGLGLNIVSALSVAVALLLAAGSLFSVSDIKQKTEQATQDTQLEENHYRSLARDFPKTPIPGLDLKTAVELTQKLDELNQNPQRLMQIVSEAFETQPELIISRLRWKQTEDAKFVDADSPNKTKTAAGQAPEPVPPPPPSGLYEIGFIDGQIKDFNGDYRAALASVSQLVEQLKKNVAIAQVTVIQQPVNTNAHEKLQGNTLENDSQQQDPANFTIKLYLKPKEITPPTPQAKP
ncbi:MAG: hypothetical protein ACKVN9_06425 [Methylophilaceae bacterium]